MNFAVFFIVLCSMVTPLYGNTIQPDPNTIDPTTGRYYDLEDPEQIESVWQKTSQNLSSIGMLLSDNSWNGKSQTCSFYE